ncbi:hypothetical protein LQ567_10440 [Niabella pedocola]|uniref:PLAT domain-containing protein n=1 Tax=Niabella pedocola TaxID=1752077 RepID=A0ABS8PQ15_9BACT|nr:hypothetical protein [Niabella pedocola]MCD2423183.1 hypothetical protein [Niabella pedocola]
MHTSFNKIVHFTRLIKINGRLREFNYRKNNNAGSYVFDVDTADDRGNRLFFRLLKEDNEWQLTAKMAMPEWVTDNRELLITELEEGVLSN